MSTVTTPQQDNGRIAPEGAIDVKENGTETV